MIVPCAPPLSAANISNLFFFLSLAVGQIELTWIQNSPLGFGKNIYHTKKTIYSLNEDNVLGLKGKKKI
jgi:hypothetical protein